MSKLVTKADGASLIDNLSPGEIEALKQEGVPLNQEEDSSDGSGEDSGNADDEESGSEESCKDDEQESESPFESPDFDNNELNEKAESLDESGKVDAGMDSSEDDEFQAGAYSEVDGIDVDLSPGDDEYDVLEDLQYRDLARVMQDHMRKLQKSKKNRRERSGRFDTRSVVRAEQGHTDVFVNESKPDVDGYHLVIAFDDSGSMTKRQMRVARKATLELGLAADETGIDSTIMRFDSSITVHSPVGLDVEQTKKAVAKNTRGGSTSLLPALEETVEINERVDEQVVLVVVTDGKPHNESGCRDLLNEMRFPTMSLQLESHKKFEDAYDAFHVCKDEKSSSHLKAMFRREVIDR